jgi:hypothetical protein
MTRQIGYLLPLLLLPLAGCGVDLPSPEEPTPEVLFIALDGTGSYDHLTEAKKAAIRALERAPAGSKVYVRWITGNSASDAAAIASAHVPEGSANPYRSGDEKLAVKKRLAQAIADAEFPSAPRTDLEGLLWAAEQRFRKHPKLVHRLLLATDLAGNAGRDFPEINLSGAEVLVAGFEVDPARPKREQRWKKTLREVGADTVKVRYLDQPLAQSN